MEININHFKLDKFNLETECCRQASLYQFYAQLLADKQTELDKKNLQLDQKEAEWKIRAKNENPKATVDQIASGVIQEFTEDRIAIIDLKHEVATLKTAVSAMEQKRSMIEVEAKLQNNTLYQQKTEIADHSSAEWATEVLRKQLNEK